MFCSRRFYEISAALLIASLFVVLSSCSSSSSPPISITLSAPTQAIDVTQTVMVTATLANDSANKGASWTLTGPGTLSSSLGTAINYIAPTTETGPQQATVTATSIADPTKTATLQITVNPYPQIPFQSLLNGSVGASYSQMVPLYGGTPPFTWTVYNGPIETGNGVGGSVPNGLALNGTTGAISGTPTNAGTWYFEVIATDATGLFGYNALTLEVTPTAAPGNPVPFLNQTLLPTAISPGSSDFTLTVSGSGFVSGSTIDFNNTGLSTTFLDNEHLSATIPAASVANAGTASISVVNPSPGGGFSNVVYFQIAEPEADVSFTAAQNSPLSAYLASGVAAADFNEDGIPDFAVASATHVEVFLGKGDGTFNPATGSPVPLLSPPFDDFASPYSGPLIAADFNSSNFHPGLAVALTNNAVIDILFGLGDGTFAPSSAAFAGTFDPTTSALAAADFNADGNLDLVEVNQIYDSGSVLLGYGAGAFITAGNVYMSGFPMGVAVGDFNGDGKLDTVVASGATPQYPASGLAVSLGVGNGTFIEANGSPILFGEYLSAIVAGDFNGDGKLDVAVADSTANVVYILLGNGDGTLASPTTIPVGTQPEAIITGDFNNDGFLDLAVANFADNTVTILLGNGAGAFTPSASSPYAVGKGPYALAAADFNGDGLLDLAVANLTDGTVSILLQTGGCRQNVKGVRRTAC